MPKGTFEMGARDYDKDARKFEKPLKTITIDQHFYMGRFEVTRTEYGVCVDEGVCRPREKSGRDFMRQFFHPITPGHPIENITWADAQTYVAWLSKRTGNTYRLPTEAEWEYAARGMTETIYWWGDEIGVNHVNCEECGNAYRDLPYPVGSFPANPFGLYDMLGNVREWVADCWHPNLDRASQGALNKHANDCFGHVIKGGGFGWPIVDFRASNRVFGKRNQKFISLGFRVLREVEQ